jgi:hypothetical protein
MTTSLSPATGIYLIACYLDIRADSLHSQFEFIHDTSCSGTSHGHRRHRSGVVCDAPRVRLLPLRMPQSPLRAAPDGAKSP